MNIHIIITISIAIIINVNAAHAVNGIDIYVDGNNDGNTDVDVQYGVVGVHCVVPSA